MKRTVEIKVLGQKFNVRSDSDEDHVNEVARFVDEKMNEVLKISKSVASLNVAILAAMNIADEYLKYRKEKDNKLQLTEKRIKDIIELIDIQT